MGVSQELCGSALRSALVEGGVEYEIKKGCAVPVQCRHDIDSGRRHFVFFRGVCRITPRHSELYTTRSHSSSLPRIPHSTSLLAWT